MKQIKFFTYFTQKLKFSARRVSTSQEVWHIFISRGRLLVTSIVLFVVLLFGVFSFVVYTPGVLDRVPGYIGKESREKLMSSLLKLDSLQVEVEMWQRYTYDLQSILDGRPLETVIERNDSLKGKIKAQVAGRSLDDSLLRASVLAATGASIDDRRDVELSFSMIAPIDGDITTQFSGSEGNMGVVLSPRPNSVVLAVMDGTVVYNGWTPSDGYVVVMQHAASMMSVYKNLQQSLKPQGSRVKAGEGLGISENITEDKKPIFKFELWSAGNAVDPENYIAFKPYEDNTTED